MPATDSSTMTLAALSRLIAAQLSVPGLRGVWIVAETSDLAVRSGHCYMELLDKSDSGDTVAKARAAVWASTWRPLSAKFFAATGKPLATGMKVRLRVSVDYHAVFGFKLIVNDIDPTYTIGDAIRRRLEILEALKRDGVMERNKSLTLNTPALRVAVISAPGAAGYGDFINQLYGNKQRLHFQVRLFQAVMQGSQTAPTVISALESIAAEADLWDVVVIIRGGGATSDLEAFDDYELAYHVASCPLPVVVGIGHERDVTVLDYVANRRVKTPTAAAEWLIAEAAACLDHLKMLAGELLINVNDRIGGCNEQLSRLETMLAMSPRAVIDRADARLKRDAMIMAQLSQRVIAPRLSRLDSMAGRLAALVPGVISRRVARLDAIAQMLELLSPQATLRRGYSITRVDGKAITDPRQLVAGQVVETTVVGGRFTSVVK